jgi:hypothetical protein
MDALQMLLDGRNTEELPTAELQEALAIEQEALDAIPEVSREEEEDNNEDFDEDDNTYM